MRRRSLLQASGGVFALPVSGVASTGTRVATADDAYEPLGRVDVDGAAEAVVGDDGETAYVATTTGFATVDVSDPEAPAVLAEERDLEVDGESVTEILDVNVDGDRLVVPAPANRTPESVFHGFLLVDVSDPETPELAGDPYETGFHIHNCYLDGDTLYVVANDEDENPLVVYDVSDDDPEEIGRWSLLESEPGWEEAYWLARYLHDVYVHDDVACLAHWNAGTYLLDVNDPSEPEYVSRVMDTDLEETLAIEDDQDAQFGLPGNDHYAAVDETGTLLAVGREAWETGGDEPDGPGGIDLYDVSDLTEPELRSTINPPEATAERYEDGLWTTAHNFELYDGDLYSSWYQGGVAIHDVSDPAEPEVRTRWRDPDTAGFWTARVADPGSVFVASSTPLIAGASTEGALYTFPIESGDQAGDDDGDVTDPDPAVESATTDTESMPGFTATTTAGVAGGLVALEWLRRNHRA